MPCMKCANGKWKYGEPGRCQFDTLAACKAAAAAIHIGDKMSYDTIPVADPMGNKDSTPQPVPGNWHDPLCPCQQCGYKPM